MSGGACSVCGGHSPTMVLVYYGGEARPATAYCRAHVPPGLPKDPKAATEGPLGPSDDSRALSGPHRG